MSSQDVARGIEDNFAVINFNSFRMRRVVSQGYIGAGIDQVVRKFAVIWADFVSPIRRPMDRNQDVIHLRPQLTDVLLNQKGIHGNDSRTAVSCECRFAKVIELRVANEAELYAIPHDDDGLSSFGKIAPAAGMGNARRVKIAYGVQEPSFFGIKRM